MLGYVTGTEEIVTKQDKILKILKGVYNRGDPPLSIPNREVKPLSADGTALWWESRLAQPARNPSPPRAVKADDHRMREVE